jgi:hypothetical protein
MNCLGVDMSDYMFQILYLDQEEHKYIQQGHCSNASVYSFDKTMKELKS